MRSTWQDYYPSKYLDVTSVTSGDLTLTIDRLAEEEMPDLKDKTKKVIKPIAYFREANSKPLVVGKGLSKILKQMFGPDPMACVGQTITLFSEQQTIFGEAKLVLSIRLRVANPPGHQAGAKKKARR